MPSATKLHSSPLVELQLSFIIVFVVMYDQTDLDPAKLELFH